MSVELLFLNNKDMEKLGDHDMKAIMEDVAKAYVLDYKGDVIAPAKCVMRWGSTPEDENVLGRINAMPGYVGGEYDMAGIKWIGSGPMNYKKGLPRASVTVVMNDPDTKLPVCICDGTHVSAMRTGAGGGLAVRELSRKDSKIMMICGAGAQGRTQLQAAMLVRDFKKVYVYDIRREQSEKFVTEARANYPGVDFEIVDTPEEAAKIADVIVCVTLADKPFIKGEWLKPGSLIMNLADYEVTETAVERASKVVVDNWETIKHRQISTVALMWSAGKFKDEDIHASIGEVLAGDKPGRENDEEIIYFNAVGTGLLDLAVCARFYRKALKEGIGTKLTYWED